MKKVQKSSLWVTGLFMLLICGGMASVTRSLPLSIAQNTHRATDYRQAMASGYDAAIKLDYAKALEHFGRALMLRPDDQSARIAINNIKRYQGGGKGFHVTPFGVGAPSIREQAATRKQNCLDGKKLIAIIPNEQLGLTSRTQPTLLFHIPPTSAKSSQIRLQNSTGITIYERTLKQPITSRFAEFNFAEFNDSPVLTPEATYQWTFTLHCDPQDPSANVTVSGAIRRIKLDSILESRLKNVNDRDRAYLYAINGLWYDAVKALVNARQASPTDANLAKDWAELLKSVGLDEKVGG